MVYYHDERLIISLLPDALLGLPDIPRPENLPILTEKQMEAIEVVQMLAAKHQRVLRLELGDLVFVNNLALVHARQPFEDSAEKCRYLVRLWLKNEKLAWKLPRQIDVGNQLLFDDDDIEEMWNIAPEPRLSFTIRERFSP